jgi:hypothetical protein
MNRRGTWVLSGMYWPKKKNETEHKKISGPDFQILKNFQVLGDPRKRQKIWFTPNDVKRVFQWKRAKNIFWTRLSDFENFSDPIVRFRKISKFFFDPRKKKKKFNSKWCKTGFPVKKSEKHFSDPIFRFRKIFGPDCQISKNF